jgi:hypothetical protein
VVAAPQPKTRPVSKVLLIAVFLTGPIAWSVHELLSEILISAACSHGIDGFRNFVVGPVAGWQIVLLIETAVFALIVLAADVLAFRSWRLSRVEAGSTGAIGGVAGRSAWMALAGMLLSTMFLLGIIAAGVTLFWLSGCG